MFSLHYSRRDVLRSSVGVAGLTLPTFLHLRSSAEAARPKANSCIVLYLWGGLSHYESFDPKPEAPSELRGEFAAISTATPGIQFCEHIPLLAKHSEKLAIVRSVHHTQGGHQQGMYVNMTGQNPPGGVRAKNRSNWPSLTAMISRFRDARPDTLRSVRVPYSMYDNGTLMAGDDAGWLGPEHDPILLRTPAGRPFKGVTRYNERELDLRLNLSRTRFAARRSLLEQLERRLEGTDESTAVSEPAYDRLDQYRKMAADLLLDSAVKRAYELEREDPATRELYGDHVCGQSLLLARRLTEAGVPVVQVLCSAGDLAGGNGDNWDTHHTHFPRMKDRLLPVFDRSASALLTDLERRGRLGDTLVVVLTDFGRTPRVNQRGGRDHHPGVYSIALAGGGIRGGQVYGSSDRHGAKPATDPCSPGDVHATIYRALGISHRAELHDSLGRPYQICNGDPLPLL